MADTRDGAVRYRLTCHANANNCSCLLEIWWSLELQARVKAHVRQPQESPGVQGAPLQQLGFCAGLRRTCAVKARHVASMPQLAFSAY